MTDQPLKVLAIVGSLRKGSYNRALFNAARELAPATLQFTEFDRLGDIPLYNADMEEGGDPESVKALKDAIRAADLLLIFTPEYNQSIPGVLKNALDWASRSKDVLAGKPTAILGASPGMGGSISSQAATRLTLSRVATPVMPSPEVAVSQVHAKLDEAGKLTDETTLKFLGRFLGAAEAWARTLQPSK